MKKIIKKYGGTHVVTLTNEDMRSYGLSVGDVVEVIKPYNVLIDFKDRKVIDWIELKKKVGQDDSN